MIDVIKDSGELILEKRIKLNMTQKELADHIGLGKSGERSIRRWETGEVKPDDKTLNKILAISEEIPFDQSKDDSPYKMIDLFAGIGGTRLGFQQTNEVKSIFTSELDKFSQKTYKANFGDAPYGDITKIAATDIPDHDILVGGFPCQAFSIAGKQLGFEDTRGTLFFEIARILKEKQPPTFLLENVKNLKTHDHGRTFKVIMATLEELGYYVYPLMYKARDFGVPQNRERIYLVGFHKDQVPNYLDFVPPVPPKPQTRVGDILEIKVDDKYTISDQLWQGHQRRKQDNKAAGKGFGYSMFDENSEYTSTLSARYYKDGSEILINQGKKNPRKITPTEAKRLQGFPEDFVIPVSDTQAYRQFGNSVAVPVINAIAKAMLEVMHHNPKKD